MLSYWLNFWNLTSLWSHRGNIVNDWLLIITWTFMYTIFLLTCICVCLGRWAIRWRLNIISFKLIVVIVISFSVNWIMLYILFGPVRLWSCLFFICILPIKLLLSNWVSLWRNNRWYLFLIATNRPLRNNAASIFILALWSSSANFHRNIVVRIVCICTSFFVAFKVWADSCLFIRHSTVRLTILLSCCLLLLSRKLGHLGYIYRLDSIVNGCINVVLRLLRYLLLFYLWQHWVSSIVSFSSSLFLF